MTIHSPTPGQRGAVSCEAAGGWSQEAPVEHGLYWVMRRYDSEPVQARFRYRGGLDGGWIRIAIAGAGSYAITEFVLFGPSIVPPDGWREAMLDAAGEGRGR